MVWLSRISSGEAISRSILEDERRILEDVNIVNSLRRSGVPACYLRADCQVSVAGGMGENTSVEQPLQSLGVKQKFHRSNELFFNANAYHYLFILQRSIGNCLWVL